MPRNLRSVPKFIEDHYPSTEGSFRWLLFRREENGLLAQGVVVSIGHRLYVDLDRWDSWIESQQPANVA